MNALEQRISDQFARKVHCVVAQFASDLAGEVDGALAVLFYGSNLRTGSLSGVLDYYVLTQGAQAEKIWPRVSYHEAEIDGEAVRAKLATMSLEKFTKACSGRSRDTTIWARFVQPCALIWQRDDASGAAVLEAVADAAQTAARLAAALGPERGPAEDFWRALFRATYKAEFRVEKPGREDSILSVNAEHFDGLLPLAWEAEGLPFAKDGNSKGAQLQPHLSTKQREDILSWWGKRQRLGKALNIIRLLKASTTFDGASRYAAWKIERHSGVSVEITPWREKHPVLAAPGVLFHVWKEKRRQAE